MFPKEFSKNEVPSTSFIFRLCCKTVRLDSDIGISFSIGSHSCVSDGWSSLDKETKTWMIRLGRYSPSFSNFFTRSLQRIDLPLRSLYEIIYTRLLWFARNSNDKLLIYGRSDWISHTMSSRSLSVFKQICSAWLRFQL